MLYHWYAGLLSINAFKAFAASLENVCDPNFFRQFLLNGRLIYGAVAMITFDAWLENPWDNISERS